MRHSNPHFCLKTDAQLTLNTFAKTNPERTKRNHRNPDYRAAFRCHRKSHEPENEFHSLTTKYIEYQMDNFPGN